MDMDDIMSVYYSGSNSDTNLYNCQIKDFLTRNVINILVVDDDATSLSVIAAILHRWKYRVAKAKHAIDALCTLRMKGGIKFDLVVTDVHMPDMDGFELQNQIRKEFVNLPVVFMSGDQTHAAVAKGLTDGALGFIKKPMGADDLRDLWQYVHDLKKDLENDDKEEESKKIAVRENNNNSDGGTGQSKKDLKRAATTSNDNVEQKKEKRAKLVWTTHLHYRFLDALRILGKESCVPKNILELMNVPGLTREHIASRLQKYRLFLNRVKDKSSGYQYSRTADQNLQHSCLLSENPASLMLNNIGQQQMLSPSLYQRTGGHNNFPVLNSLNLTNVSNPNHAAPMTNPIPPSRYGQSHLLIHHAISSGSMTGTSSSMTMYQPPKQAPPNLFNNGPSTYGTPTLGIGGCGGSTVTADGTIGASSRSGLVQNMSDFNSNYNGYQTPAEQNFVGNERKVDQPSDSMNKSNSSILDLIFSRKPGDPSDRSSIILNGINKRSSTNNQQNEPAEPNLGAGTSMGASHVEDQLMMNGQHSNDMYSQVEMGETSMLNNSNPSASHPIPAGVIDDVDFLASLLVPEEPYGMDIDKLW